jgi:predicted enzyme related to lactoylglutathione lyase
MSPAPVMLDAMTKTTTNPVNWFEIATSDPDSAMRFYGELFGWTFSDFQEGDSDYRIIDTGTDNGIRGGLSDTKGSQPNHALFYVEVPDVAKTCAQAEVLGGKVLMPATEAAGGLVFAYLLDVSGNHIAVYTPPKG